MHVAMLVGVTWWPGGLESRSRSLKREVGKMETLGAEDLKTMYTQSTAEGR